MTGFASHWQDLTALTVLAGAAAYLLRRAYRAAQAGTHGSSCGGCPANPANRVAGGQATGCGSGSACGTKSVRPRV